MELRDFVRYVKETAEDSDYSRDPELYDTTNGDITAAAVVLWRELDDPVENPPGAVELANELIAVLKRRYGTFMDLYTVGDDGGDKRTQVTIEHMTEMHVPDGLRHNVIEAIGRGRITNWRKAGYQVVDLGGPMDLRMLVSGAETNIHVFAPKGGV